jgi:hypothetical protein
MTIDGAAPEIDTARGPRSIRFDRREAAGFLGYLAAQVFCIVGLVTARYPDSYRYMQLSFTGKADFPPTVPLVYAILPTDALRVGAQTALATVCWWALARVASNAVRDRRIRISLRAVLLMLGVVGPVVSWNTVILSESIAISLTALLVAAWLWFQRRPSWTRAFAAITATEAWDLAKPTGIVLGALIAMVAVVHALRHRRELLRVGIALTLVALSVMNAAVFSTSGYLKVGLISDVIQDRILVNPGYTVWFIDHGMPYSPAIAKSAGGDYGIALEQIPAMESWMAVSATSTYIRFVVAHPEYAVIAPLSAFPGEEPSLQEPTNPVYAAVEPNPTPSMLSPTANYGRHRQVLPSVVEDFLFEQGQIGNLLALAAGAVTCALLVRRRGKDRRLVLPALVALSAVPWGYLVWLTGGVGEVDRLSVVLAVAARIGLWLLLGFALDHLVTSRSTASSVPSRGSGSDAPEPRHSRARA